MDSKLKNIITSLALLAAFFMPWIKIMGFGGSAFDLIKIVVENIQNIGEKPIVVLLFLLLLFPISGLIVLVNYVKDEIKSSQVRIIGFAKKAPFILIIIALLLFLFKFSNELGFLMENKLGGLLDVFSFGFYVTIISSIILFFDKTNEIDLKKHKTETTSKTEEKINKDDLFN